MMTRQGIEEAQTSGLLVESNPPSFPKKWSIVGMLWVLIHSFVVLFSGELLAVYSSLFFGLSLIFFLTALRVWPHPRPHIVTRYYVVFLLLVLFLSPDNGLAYASMFLLPLLTAVCFSWLVRGKFYIETTLFFIVAMVLIFQAQELLIVLENQDIRPDFIVEPYFFIILLHVLIAFALKSKGIKNKLFRFTYLVPSIVLFIVVSRLDHTPLSERYSLPTPNSLVQSLFGDISVLFYLLTAVFTGIVILFLFRNRKERGRWKKHGDYTGLLVGGSILALMFLTMPALLKGPLSADYFAYIGLMFGLVFIGRERQIYEDVTRHPACRRSFITDYLQEVLIALQSVGGFLGALFRKNDLTATVQKRKVLESGGKLYSPYSNGKPRLIPLVMHMHTNRWEGCFTPDEIVQHYSDIGFNAVFITDHNRITMADHPASVLPAYEHGWGPHHHHVLVMDAKERLQDLFPFGGKIDSRRDTLKRLREISSLIVLAHPEHRNAWSKEDVLFLDYDAIELFNKSSDSFTRWDEALKGGLLVWGTAGDDCHDPRSRHQTGKRYLLLDVKDYSNPLDDSGTIKRDVLLDVLEKGSFFAVKHSSRDLTRLVPDVSLPIIENINISSDSVTITFDRAVEKALVVDGSGDPLEFLNTRTIAFDVKRSSSFARVQVEHRDHVLSFNPFARISKSFTV